MFTGKPLKSELKKYVNGNTRRGKSRSGFVETEIVFKNVKNVAGIFDTIKSITKKKPDVQLIVKYIHGNNIRADVIGNVSSTRRKGDRQSIYSKTKFSEPLYISDSIRANCKLETPLKTDPIIIPELIRAMYRFSYEFNGFTVDISFVKSGKVPNQEGFTNKYASILRTIKEAFGNKLLANLRDSQDPGLIATSISHIIELLRPEIEIEFKRPKDIDYDQVIQLIGEFDKCIITPSDSFDEYIRQMAFSFNVPQSLLYNKPIDFTRSDLEMLKSVDANPDGFAISYKKDGIRMQIVINRFGNILIAPKPNGDVYRINDTDGPIHNAITLIDAEFIEETGEYYAFDLVVYRGTLMDSVKFPKRIDILQDIISADLQDFMPIETTPFFSPSNGETLSTIATTLLREKKTKKSVPFEIDGLIYTPITGTYEDTIFRWKPENTIDFVVDYEKKHRKQFMYKIYSHAGSVKSRNLPPGIHEIVTFEEYPEDTFTIFQHANRSVNRLTSPTELVNHGIYELAWRNKKWVVLRYREDKKRPNYIIPARMIYSENILNPITEAEITNLPKVRLPRKTMKGIYFDTSTNPARHKKLNQMAGFHNAVKGKIYDTFILPQSRLLDIGSGRANDLPRWINKRFTEIVGVEINRDNIAQAESRIESSDLNSPVEFYNYGFFEWFGSKKNEWKKYTKSTSKFDVVTIFFSSHYFLATETEYVKFFKLLSRVLRPKAKVIIIDIDGAIIFENLIKRGIETESGKYRFGLIPEPTLDSSAYIFEMDPAENELPKKPKLSDFRPGIKVNAFVSKIGTVNTEYLLDIDTLINIGRDNDFGIVDRRTFEQYRKQMRRLPDIRSDALRTISYSNTSIIFEYNPSSAGKK